MHELEKQIQVLAQEVTEAASRIKLDQLEGELKQLQSDMQRPDFWSDNLKAQDVSKQAARTEERIAPWRKLQAELRDCAELVATHDESLKADIERQIVDLQERFMALKQELKFNGPYDDHNVVVSIHAGAGGTDAQDWVQMLLRMYVRWAEAHNVEVETLEQSAGEEAGLKSVTLTMSGTNAFGKLKGEHGVHRLVRLSPFNADSLRQTSFAKVEVTPKIDQPDEVEIDEKDLKIDVYRSGGHGGQSVNTTDSAVRITHIPTGIVVAIQNERSQLQNRDTAMKILRGKLAQLQLDQHAANVAELKGPNEQAAWGNQIRSYVLHPYTMVKDLRTRHETSDVQAVLDGDLDPFIDAYLEYSLGQES